MDDYHGPRWARGLHAEMDEENRCTVWMDSKGNEVRRVKWPRPTSSTGIEVSAAEDPRAYHRIYYQVIRRFRDGRTPRGETSKPVTPSPGT